MWWSAPPPSGHLPSSGKTFEVVAVHEVLKAVTLGLPDLEDFHFTSSSYNSANANLFLVMSPLWLF